MLVHMVHSPLEKLLDFFKEAVPPAMYGVPISPHPPTLVFVFMMIAILVCMKWYLLMALTNDVSILSCAYWAFLCLIWRKCLV